MIWLYRLLFLPALLLAVPYYGARMLKRGGYAKDFSHRWGGQKNLPTPANGKKRIWLQAVSVGEVEALEPLIEKLSADNSVEIVLTTTTSTAYAILKKKYENKVLYTGVFPIDFAPFSIRAWNKIKPDLVILMEGEIWPEHLHQAKVRKIPVALINARMSDKSFARYSKIPILAQRLFKKFSLVGASSEFDMERIAKLGAPQDKTFNFGNLKFDSASSTPLSEEKKLELKREMGFAENSLILLGSSTWAGEEQMLIQAMTKLRAENIDCRLLIVPRHAERRGEIIPLLETFPHCVRSQNKQAKDGTLIYLADTTGELRMFTQLADIAFVGKSLPPHKGGQSPIDCAASGIPMIYGPNMSNFRRVCETLERSNASIKVPNTDAAISEIRRAAKNSSLRDTLSDNAKQWHSSNIGATERTFNALKALLAK